MASTTPASKSNPPAPRGPAPEHSLSGGTSGHGGQGGHDEHESAIKTPRQLITVVVLAFVVPILIIIMLAVFMNQSFRTGAGAGALTPEAIEARIKPVAGFELKVAGAATELRSGEDVYKAVCSACHATGAAGAPKLGDKAAWEPRIALGLETLTTSSLKGKGAMPAQGGGTPDLEVARAVVYLSNAGGASFEEPKAPTPEGAQEGAAATADAAAPAVAAPPVAAPAAAPAVAAPPAATPAVAAPPVVAPPVVAPPVVAPDAAAPATK